MPCKVASQSDFGGRYAPDGRNMTTKTGISLASVKIGNKLGGYYEPVCYCFR